MIGVIRPELVRPAVKTVSVERENREAVDTNCRQSFGIRGRSPMFFLVSTREAKRRGWREWARLFLLQYARQIPR